VADGAARQAAWVLAGGDTPPAWPPAATTREFHGELTDGLRERYHAAAAHPLDRLA
jgi:xylulokinase